MAEGKKGSTERRRRRGRREWRCGGGGRGGVVAAVIGGLAGKCPLEHRFSKTGAFCTRVRLASRDNARAVSVICTLCSAEPTTMLPFVRYYCLYRGKQKVLLSSIINRMRYRVGGYKQSVGESGVSSLRLTRQVRACPSVLPGK